MQVVHDLRDDLRSRMPDRGPLDAMVERFQHGSHPEAADPKPLIGGRTSEEVLWACTTCGACQEVCPVFIDQPEKILQMRQNLVLVQEKVPPDLADRLRSLLERAEGFELSSALVIDAPTDDKAQAVRAVLENDGYVVSQFGRRLYVSIGTQRSASIDIERIHARLVATGLGSVTNRTRA